VTATRVDRREQIVEAAAAVLAREGYERASMKQIADEIGVAAGLLHYYFEGKEALLSEVAARIHARIEADWAAAVEGVDDPVDRIGLAVDRIAERFEQQPEHWRLLLDMYAVGIRNPVIKARLARMADDMVAHVTEEAERIAGELPSPSPVPADGLALATMGALDGIGILSLLRDAPARDGFRALKGFLLAYVAMAYVAAGKEPPLERMQRYLVEG
jgi:AcrR family transcriptional regulator